MIWTTIVIFYCAIHNSFIIWCFYHLIFHKVFQILFDAWINSCVFSFKFHVQIELRFYISYLFLSLLFFFLFKSVVCVLKKLLRKLIFWFLDLYRRFNSFWNVELVDVRFNPAPNLFWFWNFLATSTHIPNFKQEIYFWIQINSSFFVHFRRFDIVYM